MKTFAAPGRQSLAPAQNGKVQAPGGTAEVRNILHTPRPQPKLTVGAPDDAFEREADQVAGQVMRMPEPAVQRMCAHCREEMEGEGVVRRMCSECEEEMHAKEEPGERPSVPDGFERRFSALQGGGRPLAASDRAFFEPRFGRDFSGVRLHSGPAAGELARSVHARAFTLGNSIVLGAGEGAESGRELLAHELTHVVQQGGAEPGVVRRQTIHSSCAERGDSLHAAWAEGERLARQTADSLDNLLRAYQSGMDPERVSPGALSHYRNAFGDDVDGSFTELSGRFRLIERGFKEGRNLRCDTASGPRGHDDCEQNDAFVPIGNRTDVFVCPSFFATEKTATGRGLTLLHEMAHSVLGIGHEGGKVQAYSCDGSFGFRYKQAKKNAYAYAILANCLHGEGSEPIDVPVALPAGRLGSRRSVSATAGLGVMPGARRLAAVLGGKISLRAGDFVVWNPTIGFNLLSLPPGVADPSRVVAATADLGLRFQPRKSFYFDISAGGFTTFDANVGLTGTAGLGVRWKRLELGAEARALVPDADFDRAGVVVFGRAALRFR